MKKHVLLVTAIPAMLFAVACSTNNSAINKTSMIREDNPDPTPVNIVCRNCFIEEVGGSAKTKILMKKYAPESTPEFNITLDSTVPNASFPKDIIFKYGTEAKTEYDYKVQSEDKATLNFTVPALKPSVSVNIIIDATTECMSFTVDVPSEGAFVAFEFSGALDHVEWGQEESSQQTSHYFSSEGEKEVKVYGDLSSVWFTDRKEPKSNRVLGDGNEYITSVMINHSISSLPNYAFNGCIRLEETYIGSSVEKVGKQVFARNGDESSVDTVNVIYTSHTSGEIAKKPTWSKEWTDCPICYGVPASEMKNDHTSEAGLRFKLINVDGEAQPCAMITGSRFAGGIETEGTLEIPGEISDAGGMNQYKVCSVAPFAFCGYEKGHNITGLSFGQYFSEFGEQAFSDTGSSINQLDLSKIQTPVLSYLKIGRQALKIGGGDNLELSFPTLGDRPVYPELILDKEAFRYSGVTRIVLPDKSFQLKTISERAFANSSIKYITDDGSNFPSCIETIEDEAFASSNIEQFEIPTTVQTMGKRVFLESEQFDPIHVKAEEKPNDWDDDWDVLRTQQKFGSGPEKFEVVWGYVRHIQDGPTGFEYDITSIGGVESAILTKSDYQKRELDTVNIPGSVTNHGTTYPVVAIGKRAFANSNDVGAPENKLTTVNLPKDQTFTKIGAYAFEGCRKLSSIDIPKNVTMVGKEAFNDCWPMDTSEGPGIKVFYEGTDEQVKNWDENWDSWAGSTNGAAVYTNCGIKIPHGSTSSAFDIVTQGTDYETNAIIYNYVPSGTDPEKVEIPDTLTDGKYDYKITSIGGKSFMNANLTGGINFENASNLTSIGTAAFNHATLPGTVTLPASVNKIEKLAFKETIWPEGELEMKGSLTIDLSKTSISEIPEGAFSRSCVTSLSLPQGELTLGEYAFESSKITALDISQTGMTYIPDRLFANSEYNALDNLPADIVSIGAEAFAHTKIENADLSSYDSLTTIKGRAFADCNYWDEQAQEEKGLKTVILPSDFEEFDFEEDEEGVFINSSSLETLDLSHINHMVSCTSKGLLNGCQHFDPDSPTMPEGVIKIPANKDLYEEYTNDPFWGQYKQFISRPTR